MEVSATNSYKGGLDFDLIWTTFWFFDVVFNTEVFDAWTGQYELAWMEGSTMISEGTHDVDPALLRLRI